MPNVGATLKRARLEQGLELGTVAARTKINAKYLEAIESDDRKKFPSGFFYKSFVDQYAKSLSLDTREIDAEIDLALSADEPLPLPGLESVAARSVRPMKSSRRITIGPGVASAISLVLVVAACSGFYALWRDKRSSLNMRGVQAAMENVRQFATSALAKSTPQVAPVPKAVKAIETPPSQPVIAAAPAQVAIAPSVPAPEFTPSAVSLTSNSGSDQPDEDTASASEPPSDYKVVLDLVAREATWLSVSSDGKPVFSGTLQPNQTKSVSGKQFAKMRVGNAAGIEVRLNGKLLAPLGARGQVLIVLFTPDNFQVFAPPPKESD